MMIMHDAMYSQTKQYAMLTPHLSCQSCSFPVLYCQLLTELFFSIVVHREST